MSNQKNWYQNNRFTFGKESSKTIIFLQNKSNIIKVPSFGRLLSKLKLHQQHHTKYLLAKKENEYTNCTINI